VRGDNFLFWGETEMAYEGTVRDAALQVRAFATLLIELEKWGPEVSDALLFAEAHGQVDPQTGNSQSVEDLIGDLNQALAMTFEVGHSLRNVFLEADKQSKYQTVQDEVNQALANMSVTAK
jgi:hypothetical protein